MRTKVEIETLNQVAVTAFVISVGAGTGVGLLMHSPVPIIIGAVIGIYLLFAIKVVQQWEKVALLRLGRYVGLRGPGWFHMIPGGGDGEPLHRPAGAGAQRDGGIDIDPRYGSCECGRDRVLDGVERGEGDSRSGELHGGRGHERADGAARVDRPA